GVSEEELADIAIRSMGLNELKPFDPKEKIIEFKMDPATSKKSLLKMNLRQFCNETLSDSPAPGGGSVAALMGALGVSLGGMVANLSAGKRGWDDKLDYFSDCAVKSQGLKDEKSKSVLLEKLQKIRAESEAQFGRITQVVESKMG